MTEILNKELSRKSFLRGGGALVVSLGLGGAAFAGKAQAAGTATSPRKYPFPLTQADSYLSINADNTATIFHGLPELGQGSSTGMIQIAAEELSMDFSQVTWARIDSTTTPNNTRAAASRGIKQAGPQTRASAAVAAQALLQMASTTLGVPVASLTVAKGVVSGGGKSVTYGELVGGKLLNLSMPQAGLGAGDAGTKPVSRYTLVGTRVPRIDIPDKVTGKYTYIHNVRIPGMLHARLVRPRGQFAYGNGTGTPLSIDESSIKHLRDVQIVRKGDFVAVVAPHEYDAIQAAALLKVTWKEPAIPLPGVGNVFGALRQRATQSTAITWRGDVATGFAQSAKTVSGSYSVAYHSHGALGPQCIIADVKATSALIMCPAQDMGSRQSTVANILGLPFDSVRVMIFEGGGSYGGGTDIDAPLAAAVISQQIGKPIRLQYMRWDEAGWDNFAPGAVIDMRAGVDANGKLVAYDFWDFHQGHSSLGDSPTNDSVNPTGPSVKRPLSLFRTSAMAAGGMYVIPHRRVNNSWSNDGFLRGSPMRAPMEVQTTFASEQTIDQLAVVSNLDPVEFRRRNMTDSLWLDVLNAATKAAGWKTQVSGSQLSEKNVVTGRGIALATHSSGGGSVGPNIDFSTTPETTAAVIADIEVNKATGKVTVQHLYAAMCVGLAVNPALVENQIVGQQIMAASRVLHEQVRFTKRNVTSLDWVSYPLLRFKDHPKVTPIVVQRLDQPTRGAGEETIGGTAGAIANAFFDATGVRVHQLPLTPAVVRGTLANA